LRTGWNTETEVQVDDMKY